MQIECYTDMEGFAALRDDWDQLLEHAVTDTIFLRPFWHEAWWRAYGAGKALRLLAARDDAGQLVGVAPLFAHEMVVPDTADPLPKLSIERPASPAQGQRLRLLHPVGGSEVSDYLDWIVDRTDPMPVYEALFHYLREELRGWDLLDLHCLPAASPLRSALPQLAAAQGFKSAEVREEVCPIIALPGDWESYLSLLSRKQRHELRRKIGKAEREGAPHWWETTRETLDADLETFFQLHEQSDPEKASFWDESARSFFREIVDMAECRGWLKLSLISFQGQTVGSLLCFRYKNAILVYNSGYNPAACPSLSPGLVLFGYVIQDAIANRIECFDFLRGNERYKYDLGGQDTEVYRLGIWPG